MSDEKTGALPPHKPVEHGHENHLNPAHVPAAHVTDHPDHHPHEIEHHGHIAHTSRDFHHKRASAADYNEKKKGYVHKLSSRNYNTRIWAPFDKLERWKKIATGLLVAIAIVHLWWGVWGLLDSYLFPETRPFNYLSGIAIGILVILLTGEIIEGGGRN